MSSKTLKKTEIIYSRLKSEYGDYSNWDEFAAEFGISRQAIKDRRDKDTVDYDDIIRVFPQVNREWLFSDNLDNLRTLPVKKNLTKGTGAAVVNEPVSEFKVDELLREERSRLDIEDIPDTEMGRSLRGVLDDAVSVVLKLRRLVEQERSRVRDSDE